MLTLYQFRTSGNCYKVRLLFNQLEIAYESVEIDLKGRGPEALAAMHALPFQRVPVVKLANGDVIAESSAILAHFAEGTHLLPAAGLARTRVMEWLFWEQYDHEHYIAVLRAWRKYFGVPKGREAEIPFRESRGYAALDRMERHLAEHDFLAGSYSIADIALYAYTHMADEGGFDLTKYPAIGAWFERVRAQPLHTPLLGGK